MSFGSVALLLALAARHRPLPVSRQAALGLRVGYSPSLRARGRALVPWAGLALVAALIHPLLGLVVAGGLLARPWIRGRRALQDRAAAIDAGVSDAVALIALAVAAGHNLLGALDSAARRAQGPLAIEMAQAVADAKRGERLADALDSLADRLGEAVRPLTSALISCERYGAPIASTLHRLGVDVRIASRQRAEAAARRVPVRLLFPLVTCILPAFGLMTVAPLIAGSLSGLGL